MAADILQQAAAYLAVPYRLGGTYPRSWDCLGLVRHLRGDLFGKASPLVLTVGGPGQAVGGFDLWSRGAQAWTRLEAPRPGAVALFRHSGGHVGLVLDETHFIHARESAGTTIERLETPAWRRLREGYYDA